VATSFRHGRVVLAGDAAHINNPLGGMGMNGGIQDVFNVADKLAQIWAGADDRLLDRYDRQRRTVSIEAVQQQTNRNHQLISERDPAIRKKSLDAMRRTAADRASARAYAQLLDDQQHAPRRGDRVTASMEHPVPLLQ
jgi:3-(3-hydroxy-phenyl)propionate hydroxylase